MPPVYDSSFSLEPPPPDALAAARITEPLNAAVKPLLGEDG